MTSTLPFPDDCFDLIYADPPWRYKSATVEGGTPYPTMSIAQLCALPVGDIAKPDSALLLWVTMPKLFDALQVIKAWGYTYKTCFLTWVKTNRYDGAPTIGIGWWTRSNAELLLLATKGQARKYLRRPEITMSQVLMCPRGKHSEKPELARRRIQQFFKAGIKRVELFARKRVRGWQAWGNEIF